MKSVFNYLFYQPCSKALRTDADMCRKWLLTMLVFLSLCLFVSSFGNEFFPWQIAAVTQRVCLWASLFMNIPPRSKPFIVSNILSWEWYICLSRSWSDTACVSKKTFMTFRPTNNLNYDKMRQNIGVNTVHLKKVIFIMLDCQICWMSRQILLNVSMGEYCCKEFRDACCIVD